MSLQTPATWNPYRRATFGVETMVIMKATVVAALRERGQRIRADFVERELPDHIDTSRHGGLLAMLRLDPSTLVESGQE
ncbi:hypothetical protein ACTI_19700 [Actinoplanes sp. OR16]|nr:hypothetical protein ACTI_19700 [Actinoplanes sp. OR16]